MKLTNEFSPIKQWAIEKGIYEKGDLKTQVLKLVEEVGELAKAVLENNEIEVEDSIGDCTVVLTNVAVLAGMHFNTNMSIEHCVNTAYNVIAKRSGKMENGTFIKDK